MKVLLLFPAIKVNHHVLHIGGSGVPFGHNNSNAVYDLNLNTLHWTCLVPAVPDWEENQAPKPKYGQVKYMYTYCFWH